MKKLTIPVVVVVLAALLGLAFLGVERYTYNSYVTAIGNNDTDKIASLENFPYLNLNRTGGEGWIFSFLSEVSCNTPLEALYLF